MRWCYYFFLILDMKQFVMYMLKLFFKVHFCNAKSVGVDSGQHYANKGIKD